jgi:nitrate/nitrite transport system substrate-binding protein
VLGQWLPWRVALKTASCRQQDCPAQYLNQPEAVLNQVLTGKFADGWATSNRSQITLTLTAVAVHGGVMLTQMKRWRQRRGQLQSKRRKVFS